MNNLDKLIPVEILEMMELERFDLAITLVPKPAGQRYPNIRVLVGDSTVFDGTIREEQTITYKNTVSLSELSASIEYYNKADTDTITDEHGNILEDQSVSITKIVVNDVDIVKSNIVYNLGKFTPNFSKEKYEYFLANGLDTGPSHTLNLFQNGVWLLDFKFPILSNFVKYKAFQELHEKWPDVEILNEIYDTIQRIRMVENNNEH